MQTRPSVGPGLARIAGICGVGAVLLQLLNIFVFTAGAPPARSASAPQIASLAAQQRVSPELGYYLDALSTLLLLVFALVVVRRVGAAGGLWSHLVLTGVVLWASIDLVWAAVTYAMRELAHYGTSSAGVATLYILSQSLLWIIALPIGLFFGALGVLALRTRLWPAALGWCAVAFAVVVIVISPFAATVPAGGGIILVASLSARCRTPPPAIRRRTRSPRRDQH